ncbi:hypothetical protein LTS07_010321 [Exophiala sideris]|uniref:Fe2OG dioxygenase domain-containing protein n=1 Tax=Exophiala sideris TaxID=1016849 RepID=A0ABR0J8T7_9EURO|nr:hypothetical protein LTS07_010321 [Exophiala sideris]KAK5037317.1 hypothetical protein LTR13_004473 [Exophiala sideris]KAK5058980.1 hypothetical protein LTR69_006267 [Exophiala sideris]KAK5182812.1 hypothetical protein LTR44_004520 [Eurotiomycetes sp. CCFEE 6388]
MTVADFDVGSGMGCRKVREPEGLTSFKDLPVIDLSDIDSPDEQKRRALASKIYDACTQVGFFYIKNHGISKDSVASIKSEAQRFFKDLSSEQKMKFSREKNQFHLGYDPYRGVRNGGKKPHPYESMMFGREVKFDKEYRDVVDPKDDAHNQWPEDDELPGFKSSVGSYYEQMTSLSRKLVGIFAQSLELDKTFFDDKMSKPGSLLSLNYYAAQSEGKQASIHAHTDHELFTILLQSDGIKALEVVNGEGVWVPAKPIEDTFVVNIGDALSIWTNNVFLSTLHRATNTSGAERYSIPFFFGVDYDCVMHTLPSCVSETRPMIYKPVTQAEHYLSKMNTAYGASSLVAA